MWACRERVLSGELVACEVWVCRERVLSGELVAHAGLARCVVGAACTMRVRLLRIPAARRCRGECGCATWLG